MAVPAAHQGKLAKVACGARHIVAVLKDGSAVAWGDAADNKLNVPAAAKAANAVTSVVAGVKYSVFLLKNGSVLKAGLLMGSSSTVVLPAGSATAIASGGTHVVVALANGKGVTVLGDKTRGQGNVPPAASQLTNATLVTAIVDCSYALTTQGLVSWGPDYCQFSILDTIAPARYTGFSAVRAGLWYDFTDADYSSPELIITLALQYSDNRTWIVYDTNPRDGSEDKFFNAKQRVLRRPVDDVIPVEDLAMLTIVQSPLSASGGAPTQQRVVELWFLYVDNLLPAELMSPEGVPITSFASCNNAVAVTSNGRLVSLGAYPEPPAELQGKVASVACSLSGPYVASLKAGGVAKPWGWDKGILGLFDVPAAARPPAWVSAVGAGEYHAVYLVGGNVVQTGQMVGPINRTQPLPPDVVAAAGSIIDVSAGTFCAAALSSTGRVFAWGLHGTNCRSGIPPEITSGQVRATRIAVGNSHILALTSSGKVVQWGQFQRGTGSFEPLPAVPADALTGVTVIAAANGYSIALKSKAVIAWGPLPCSSEVPPAARVPGSACWVAAGDEHFAIRLCNGKCQRGKVGERGVC
jgi:hypothetical protein